MSNAIFYVNCVSAVVVGVLMVRMKVPHTKRATIGTNPAFWLYIGYWLSTLGTVVRLVFWNAQERSSVSPLITLTFNFFGVMIVAQSTLSPLHLFLQFSKRATHNNNSSNNKPSIKHTTTRFNLKSTTTVIITATAKTASSAAAIAEHSPRSTPSSSQQHQPEGPTQSITNRTQFSFCFYILIACVCAYIASLAAVLRGHVLVDHVLLAWRVWFFASVSVEMSLLCACLHHVMRRLREFGRIAEVYGGGEKGEMEYAQHVFFLSKLKRHLLITLFIRSAITASIVLKLTRALPLDGLHVFVHMWLIILALLAYSFSHSKYTLTAKHNHNNNNNSNHHGIKSKNGDGNTNNDGKALDANRSFDVEAVSTQTAIESGGSQNVPSPQEIRRNSGTSNGRNHSGNNNHAQQPSAHAKRRPMNVFTTRPDAAVLVPSENVVGVSAVFAWAVTPRDLAVDITAAELVGWEDDGVSVVPRALVVV